MSRTGFIARRTRNDQCADARSQIWEPESVPGWIPYRVSSLWQLMELFEPEQFLNVLRHLWFDSVLFPPPGHPQRKAHLATLRKHLQECLVLCERFGLPVSAMKVKDTIEVFHWPPDDVDVVWVERAGQMISETIRQEMEQRRYVEIPQSKIRCLDNPDQPFGFKVAEKFPSTTFDAAEARRCYAFGRNTACVFHLMRVLEIGLGVLAQRLHVDSEGKNWGMIIEQIEKNIREIEQSSTKPPTWKDDRKFFSKCASHFWTVKNALRNYTNHAGDKYDEQEGLRILGAVEGFMCDLSERLYE